MSLTPSDTFTNETWDSSLFAIKMFDKIFAFVGEVHRSRGTAKALGDKKEEWLYDIKRSTLPLFESRANGENLYRQFAGVLAKYVRSDETGFVDAYLSISESDWLVLKKLLLNMPDATKVEDKDKKAIRKLFNPYLKPGDDYVARQKSLLKSLIYKGETLAPGKDKRSILKEKYQKDLEGLIDCAFEAIALAAISLNLGDRDHKEDKLKRGRWEEAFKEELGRLFETAQDVLTKAGILLESKDDFILDQFSLATSSIKGYVNLPLPLQDLLKPFKKTYPKVITKGSHQTVELDTKLSYLNAALIGTLEKIINSRHASGADTQQLGKLQAEILNWWTPYSVQFKLQDKVKKVKEAYEKIGFCKSQVQQLITHVTDVIEDAGRELDRIQTEMEKAYDKLIKLEEDKREKETIYQEKREAIRLLDDARKMLHLKEEREKEQERERARLEWYEKETESFREVLVKWKGEESPALLGIETMHLGELHELYSQFSQEVYQARDQEGQESEEAFSALKIQYDTLQERLIKLENREETLKAELKQSQTYFLEFNQSLIKQMKGWQCIEGRSYPKLPDPLPAHDTHALFKLYYAFWAADYAFLEEKQKRLSRENEALATKNTLLKKKLKEATESSVKEKVQLQALEAEKAEIEKRELTLKQELEALHAVELTLRDEHASNVLLLARIDDLESSQAAKEASVLSELKTENQSLKEALNEAGLDKDRTDVAKERHQETVLARDADVLTVDGGVQVSFSVEKEDVFVQTDVLDRDEEVAYKSKIKSSAPTSLNWEAEYRTLEESHKAAESLWAQREEALEEQVREQKATIEGLEEAAQHVSQRRVSNTVNSAPTPNEGVPQSTPIDLNQLSEAFKTAFEGTNSKGIKSIIKKMDALALLDDDVRQKKIALLNHMKETATLLQHRWQSQFSFFCIMKGRTKGAQKLYDLISSDTFTVDSPEEAFSKIDSFLTHSTLQRVHGRPITL